MLPTVISVVAQEFPGGGWSTWLADQSPALAILLIIVFGAFKQWWVSGIQYRQILKERDELRDILFRQFRLTTAALEAGEEIAEVVEKAKL